MKRNSNSLRPVSLEGRSNPLRSRFAIYGAVVVIGVIVAAYIDGGEEPLHPIVQEVEVPQVGVDAA